MNRRRFLPAACQVLLALAAFPARAQVIDGVVRQARLIRMVQPAYPAEAKRKGIDGTVVFDVTVGKDGHVKKLRLISGKRILADAAGRAVRQWVYKPTMIGCKPVVVETVATVEFVLPRRASAKAKPNEKP